MAGAAAGVVAPALAGAGLPHGSQHHPQKSRGERTAVWRWGAPCPPSKTRGGHLPPAQDETAATGHARQGEREKVLFLAPATAPERAGAAARGQMT